jgi:hypothetical protein
MKVAAWTEFGLPGLQPGRLRDAGSANELVIATLFLNNASCASHADQSWPSVAPREYARGGVVALKQRVKRLFGLSRTLSTGCHDYLGSERSLPFAPQHRRPVQGDGQ